MKKILIGILAFLTSLAGTAQKTGQPAWVPVEAKKWSKVNNQSVYSDWQVFPSLTLKNLKGFTPPGKHRFSRYGGDLTASFKATGYFRVEKKGERSWVVDPDGYAWYFTAVNSVRPGTSPNNEKALEKHFGNELNWIAATEKQFTRLGFNSAGSWSDLGSIRNYNQGGTAPLPYTNIVGFVSNFAREQRKKYPGRAQPNSVFCILDPEFEAFCDRQAQPLAAYANDPWLIGHFSDNELTFIPKVLDDILTIKDHSHPAYLATVNWLKQNSIDASKLTENDREAFLGFLTGIYYKTVSAAIKKYDPNHLYLGSRLHWLAKHIRPIFEAADPYVDIVSINYYGYWDVQASHIKDWKEWTSRPFMITEFYTKAEDTGMPNLSGAGWIVHTQKDRGIHYQNFCLGLLKAPNCVGWHWFKYQDNDPSDTRADPSNSDSNKGIVDNDYQEYKPLTLLMKAVNLNKYDLIRYFR